MIFTKKNALEKTSLGSNLLATVTSLTPIIILNFKSPKETDVKNVRRSRLRKVKIYQVVSNKRTFMIYT